GAGRDEQAETLGEVGELRGLEVRSEHDELLPAPAKDHVAGAQVVAYPLVEVDEQPISRGIAVRVVDLLEAVEIGKEGPGGPSAALDPRLFGRERLCQRVPVRSVRERVDASTGSLVLEAPLEAHPEAVPHGEREQQAAPERQGDRRRPL